MVPGELPDLPCGAASLARGRPYNCAVQRTGADDLHGAVQRLLVACHHVGTKFCLADIFTKATDSDTFARMRAVIRNSAEDDTGLSVRRMLTTLMRVSPRA